MNTSFFLIRDCLLCSNFKLNTSNLCESHLNYSREISLKSQVPTLNDKFVYTLTVKTQESCSQCQRSPISSRTYILEYKQRTRMFESCSICLDKFNKEIKERNERNERNN